jgi:hypothetical protein
MKNKTGGGVIVYVKEYINCIVRPDLQIDNIECLWIEIKLKKNECSLDGPLQTLRVLFRYEFQNDGYGRS